MDLFSESKLEREGARAAAQGQSWRTNPWLHAQNMPQATGESLSAWSRRHDAWQRGFEGYFQLRPEFAHRRKDKLSAEVLKTLVERRLQWLPAMRSFMAGHPRFVLRLPLPTRHDRDQQGRDWDLEDFERSMVGTAQIDAELLSIVDRLRRQYNILPCSEAAGMPISMDPCPSDGGSREPRMSVMSEPAGKGPFSTETHAAPVSLQPCATTQETGMATDMPAQPASTLEEQRLRTELGIRRIGWRYEYRSYRYDRLADAVAYARLGREHPRGQAAQEASPQADEPPPLPSSDELALMATWDIRFDAGIYTFQNYRYERLCDAVAYARLLASRQADSALQDHRS
jgi:hypothetical protein